MILLLSLLSLRAFAAPIEVQGHRGARAIYPENSLAAFNYAIETGVDTLEMDLGVSKDGVLVVNHDPVLPPERCLAPGEQKMKEPVLIHSLTLAEIKSYDCGSLPHEKFPKQNRIKGLRIATLDEVFALVRNSKHPHAKKVEFNIETKSFEDHPEYTVTPPEFASLLVKSLRKNKMFPRVVVQSFDHRTLVEVRKLEPTARISVLDQDPAADMTALAKKYQPNILSPKWELLKKSDVDALHAAKVRVIPWTANTPDVWQKLVDLGVDGIISDDPAALMTYLKAKGIQ
ncbi:MAG: hypothetical protein JST16_15105 [Bdellovibrionales bacterium]|nr:hypothetical protein [Bdellovibrionales bacterium]